MAPHVLTARIRHAQHFVAVASHAEMLYRAGGAGQTEGLRLFDLERAQIDAAWTWVRTQEPSEDSDALLNSFAYATVEIGDLRYNKRLERIPQFEAALEAAQRWNVNELIAAWLGNLGLAYTYLGELRIAAAYHAQHLDAANKLGDQTGAIHALINIGLTAYALADTTTARQAYEMGLVMSRNIADRRGEAMILGHLGPLYLGLNEPEHAEACFQQGMSIARELGDVRLQAATLGDLGNMHYQQGDAARALDCYREQLAIIRDLGNRRAEAIVHTNLGNVAFALGNASEAEQCYTISLHIADALGEQRVAALAAWNLGLQLEQRGELVTAAALFQRTVDYERSVDHPDVEADAAHLQQLRARLVTSSRI